MKADIIIAGAGPSGLVVGCEAALGGAKVVILEKRNGPTWSRAGTLAPRVMELFASRGIADKVIARAHELHHNPYSRDGIWAGLQTIDYRKLDSDFPSVLFFAQIETEKLLAEHFRSLGGELRLNCEVRGFAQDEDGVEVTFAEGDGAEQTLSARYLVGADGNRSVVREAAGIGRSGLPARRIAVNVDAFAENPYPSNLTVTDNPNGWAMTYPLRDGVTRFALIDAATMNDPVDRPLDVEDAKAMLRRVHGTDYGITEIDAINRFHDALLIADRIRDGRIFLVGEAVRIHYPSSGVGMNFCIQDAFNLGWKLAAATAGRAPEGLLDSYVTERLPEIRKLMDDVRRQCAIQFNFDEEHQALKRFIEDDLLPIPAVNLKICENLSGLSVRYPSEPGAAAIVGQRLPNLPVVRDEGGAGGVFELLRNQDFLLLDLADLERLPRPKLGLKLKVASVSPQERPALAELATLLVRPDGHVAWASDRPVNDAMAAEQVRAWLNLPADAAVFAATDAVPA